MSKYMMNGAAILFCAVAIASGVAEARERHTHAVVNTKRGTAVGDATVTRTPGERTRAATWTGPNGKTTSVLDQRTADRAAGTYTHDRTRTFADGTTRTVDADAQRTAPGQYEATRTVTNRKGETKTQTGTVDITRQ